MSEVTLPVDHIEVSDRLRNLDGDWAIEIARSIDEQGGILLEPIVVRPIENDRYKLVAGLHRLEAVKILGWKDIPVHVRTLSDFQAELAEIDENIVRRELNVLDRAIFLARKKELLEVLRPETKHGGDRKSEEAKIKRQASPLDCFTKEAAEKTGLSERTIRDAVALIKNLSPKAITELRGTLVANNGAQLKALSKLPHAEQEKIAWFIYNKVASSVSEGKAKISGEKTKVEHPDDVWMRKAIAHWGGGKKRLQDRFLEKIGAMRT